MDFTQKNVIISGGSSGIGLSLAKLLAQKGANITILARRKKLLETALKEIENCAISPSQMFNLVSADVSNYSELQNALKKDKVDYDFIFNAAGVCYPGEFVSLEPSVFDDTMDIDYLGTVYLTKLLLPRMIEKRSGYVVNFSSYVALVGYYGYTAYAPSKYAVLGFSRTLRPELKPYGIDVSVVLPQDTDTPQLAFERAHQPEVTRQTNKMIEKVFGSSSLISPEKAAEYVIQGVQKKKFTIYFGTTGLLTSYLTPLIDKILYKYTSNYKKKSL